MKDIPPLAYESNWARQPEGSGSVGPTGEPTVRSIVALACDLFKTPFAYVSLFDDHLRLFGAFGLFDASAMEEENEFCNHTAASGELLVVEDAALDSRFNRNQLVNGPSQIRFYAGIPLSVNSRVPFGVLCVMDTKPREFSRAEAAQFRRVGDIVAAMIHQERSGRVASLLTDASSDQMEASRKKASFLTRYKGLYDRASAIAKVGAWDRSADDGEIVATDSLYDIFGLPRGAPIEWKQIISSHSGRARRQLLEVLDRSSRNGRGFIFEGQINIANGRRRWVRTTVDVECENGVVIRRLGICQDITEAKKASDRLRFLAERDPLTALPNRGAFQKALHALERKVRRTSTPVALILIDVDRLKRINDTFGHIVGDQCLKQLARRLQRTRPAGTTVARLGGDEFGVLLEVPDTRQTIEECAERIVEEMRRPLRWRGQSFQLTSSVGVAVQKSAGSQGAWTLFVEADLALYAAKEAGRNTYRLFDPAMRTSANARFVTVTNISEALAGKQLELFYQPKINLNQNTHSGFEALLRWRRPDGKVIGAGEFEAALDDPELSRRIGGWVVATALRQARDWHEAGLPFGHIAINLSPSQFQEAKFAERLIENIAAHGLRADMIEVEVTEGVFLNTETGIAKEILERLRRAKIRIALDDFGTGYASLTHLRTFPVDAIKIDKRFVQNFLTSAQDNAILQSTIFLARHLRIDVVAEGIEKIDDIEFLKALGCCYGQGYLFSRAISAPEAAKFCVAGRRT